MARGKKARKERSEARRRRGFGDDLFYRQVRRHSVKVGDVVNATIGETDPEGMGVVRVGRLMISVPGSRIGEKVRIKIREIRRGSAVGELLGPED